jgi:endonuclease/exonuclease/phosphatase family metal-dependent hydrolase
MQNLRWLIVALALIGCAEAAEVVRVVSWNLEWFPGRKPTASREERDRHFLEVAAVMPQFRADVIVLQEVRDDDAAQKLAALLPGFTVHVTTRFKDGFSNTPGLQQVAILSRFKADAAWAAPWKRGWANAPRGYAYARLRIGNQNLHVYGLHLKSNLGDPIANTSKREDAMEQLVEHVGTEVKGGESVVVGGDLNTSKEQASHASDRTLKIIEVAGFFWTFEGVPFEERITIPGDGRYPDACFDHIYVRGLGRPIARVLKDTPGSDHFPVMTDITVEEK